MGSLKCISVGFVIRETDEYITLAAHLAYPDDPQLRQATGIMTIPLRAVVSRVVISS